MEKNTILFQSFKTFSDKLYTKTVLHNLENEKYKEGILIYSYID